MADRQERSDPAPKRVLMQALVGDVRLVLHGPGQPTDAEIDDHIAEALEMARSVRAVLVMADGPDAGGPNARQRAKMARVGMLDIPTAVVTASVLARGITIAVSWFGTPIKCFAPGEVQLAFEFLKISGPVRTRIATRLEGMKAELYSKPSPSPTLHP